MRSFIQHRLRRHDLSVLTESALRYLLIDPGLLHGIQPAVPRKPFECGDFPLDGRNRRDAGRNRRPVDDYFASAALSESASKPGTSQVEIVAEDIQQRRSRFHIQSV